MNWVLSHLSDENHKWLLQDSTEQAQFTYNLQHHSIRIKSKNRRLFFLEVAGSFQKKIILRSEYGVVLGETSLTTNSDEGTVSISDFKFIYQWKGNTLLLCNKNKELLSSVSVEQTDNLEKLEPFALLFSQAWIVYSSFQQKNEGLLVA